MTELSITLIHVGMERKKEKKGTKTSARILLYIYM